MNEDARCFIAIVDSGSLSAASKKLHVSQPAISQRLKQLESKLGTVLIDRSTTPIRPTFAGTVFLDWARQEIDSSERMKREIAEIASSNARRLRIGTSLPRGNEMLPDVVEEFYRQTEGCMLSLHEAGMPDRHNKLLTTMGIDCAILTPVKPESTLFESDIICDERMQLVAPASLKLDTVAGKPLPLIDPRIIGELPFIMPPSDLKHSWIIKSMMDQVHVRLKIKFHSCSNEMTLEMISRGLGVSIAPNTFTCSQDNGKLAFYSIDGFPNLNHLYYNRLIGHQPSNDQLVFMDILEQWIADHHMR